MILIAIAATSATASLFASDSDSVGKWHLEYFVNQTVSGPGEPFIIGQKFPGFVYGTGGGHNDIQACNQQDFVIPTNVVLDHVDTSINDLDPVGDPGNPNVVNFVNSYQIVPVGPSTVHASLCTHGPRFNFHPGIWVKDVKPVSVSTKENLLYAEKRFIVKVPADTVGSKMYVTIYHDEFSSPVTQLTTVASGYFEPVGQPVTNIDQSIDFTFKVRHRE